MAKTRRSMSPTDEVIHDVVTETAPDPSLPPVVDRALLAAILDALPELVFVADRNGKLVAVHGGRNVDHFHDASELVGQRLQDVLPQSRATEFLACIHEALETGSVVQHQYQLARKEIDGIITRPGLPEEQWFMGFASPLAHDDARIDLVVWMAVEVTDSQMALQLLVEHEHELEHLARTDGLTGLLNRRTFFEEAERELAWSRRSGQPQALLELDVDHFKRINDDFGHAAGDVVLQRIGEILASEVRSTDILGRIGGEEFAIVSRGSDIHQGLELAERLRSRIEAMRLDYLDLVLTCTASIGVTELAPADQHTDDALRRADSALYDAKRHGRNRVEAHTTTTD